MGLERKVKNNQLPKENKVLKRGLFILYNRFCLSKTLKYSQKIKKRNVKKKDVRRKGSRITK